MKIQTITVDRESLDKEPIATITVRITQVYGKRTVYPVCDNAKVLADLAGHKTLTEMDLMLIKRLGYIVEVETQTL